MPEYHPRSQALKKGGIYINFENIIPEDEEIKTFELLRWGRYQQRHGKTEEETKAHNARCGKNYFPLTATQHIPLLKDAGFSKVHIFWCSYMQMGIYGIKWTINNVQISSWLSISSKSQV